MEMAACLCSPSATIAAMPSFLMAELRRALTASVPLQVLGDLGTFSSEDELLQAMDVLRENTKRAPGIPVKKLLMMLEIAKFGSEG